MDLIMCYNVAPDELQLDFHLLWTSLSLPYSHHLHCHLLEEKNIITPH